MTLYIVCLYVKLEKEIQNYLIRENVIKALR